SVVGCRSMNWMSRRMASSNRERRRCFRWSVGNASRASQKSCTKSKIMTRDRLSMVQHRLWLQMSHLSLSALFMRPAAAQDDECRDERSHSQLVFSKSDENSSRTYAPSVLPLRCAHFLHGQHETHPPNPARRVPQVEDA